MRKLYLIVPGTLLLISSCILLLHMILRAWPHVFDMQINLSYSNSQDAINDLLYNLFATFVLVSLGFVGFYMNRHALRRGSLIAEGDK